MVDDNDNPIPPEDPEPQVMMCYTPDQPFHAQIHRDAFSYGGVRSRADPWVVVDLRFFGKMNIHYENQVTFSHRDDDGKPNTDLYGMPQATVRPHVLNLYIRCY